MGCRVLRGVTQVCQANNAAPLFGPPPRHHVADSRIIRSSPLDTGQSTKGRDTPGPYAILSGARGGGVERALRASGSFVAAAGRRSLG